MIKQKEKITSLIWRLLKKSKSKILLFPLFRYKERSEIEALFFSINASLKALNQPAYTPKEGQMVHDIEREWNRLEKAEHHREVALREELLRQERLEQLAYKFDKKVIGLSSVDCFRVL